LDQRLLFSVLPSSLPHNSHNYWPAVRVQEKPQVAMAALEQAVSSNFAIRESLLYHIVNARVLAANEKLEEAKKVSTLAMATGESAGMVAGS
jgi:hypothetical protein